MDKTRQDKTVLACLVRVGGVNGIAEFAGLEFAGLENDGLENDGVEEEQTYCIR